MRCAPALVLLSAVLSTGCASTRLVSERVGPATLDAPLRRIAVIGVSNDVRQRTHFESVFGAALANRAGLATTAATALVDPEQSLDRDLLREAIHDRGFDGVLVVRKVGERVEVAERRTGGMPQVDTSVYDDFHGRYLRTMKSSSSDVGSRQVRAEITLLRADDYREVWTAATDTHDPRDLDRVASELANVVIAQLRAHRLLR